MERNRFLAIVAVVIGASAFGFLGLFTRYFMETRGLSALDTVMIRVMISVIILLPILLVFNRSALRISKKDVPVFLLFGFFGIVVLSGAGAAGFALYRRRKE